MKKRLMALDLAASGQDALADEIVFCDAVRLDGSRLTDHFRECACPTHPLPLSVMRQCGVNEETLRTKESSPRLVKKLLQFLGETPVLIYGIQPELSILSMQAKGKLANLIIDVEELARILLPREDNFRLDHIAGRLGIEPVPEGARAEIVARVWLKLLDELSNLSLAVITQINLLLKQIAHPLRDVFARAEPQILRASYGTGKREIADVFRDHSSLLSRRLQEQPALELTPLDEDEICELFSQEGIFSRSLRSYEHRAEQIAMVRAVCRAFNNSMKLMVEAGTGTGKSMAYLVPAAYWAAKNREKIIISTNTKNLQSQLFFKDTPFLQEALDVGFKAALIKGRKNYLCVRKFLYLMREVERELDEDEIAAILPVVTWADLTETGDISENNGFFAERYTSLWDKLSSGGDECLGRSCRSFRNCFVRKARALAQASDVVIANHSVVFAELGLDSQVLPPYERIVFDEAHNVENVATEFLAVRVNRWLILRILRRLYRMRRDRTGKGLFTNIRFQASRAKSAIDPDVFGLLEGKISEAINEMGPFRDAADAFFGAVANLYGRERGEEKIRYDAESMRGAVWDEIQHATRELLTAIGRFTSILSALEKTLEAVRDVIEYGREFLTELRALTQRLMDIDSYVKFVTAGNEPNYVYWVDMRPGVEPSYELCAAPLDISDLMKEQVYEQKQTVIFSSATLTVNGNFHFMMSRLGLEKLPGEEVEAIDVGTPFDFDNQTRVLVPAFLPNPARDADFNQELAYFLVDLLKTSLGRGMVLFTAYSMLNEVYPLVKSALEQEGILVLGQGKDGPRDSILATFRKQISSVLLGTQSFWEGVDVVGEALSLLVIVRLPFHVYTEPIHRARCELIESQGMDSFLNYSVPSAVIRLKQGFGRLIRTRTDRGVVILADKRVITKTYGRAFLSSLPTRWRSMPRKENLLNQVSSFLQEVRGKASGRRIAD